MSANIAALFQNRSSPTPLELQTFAYELTKSDRENIFFNKGRFHSKKQLYVAAMENLVNTGRMFNMHGDHVWNLGATESGDGFTTRPQAVQVPPNQIWVLLTKKYTVTYAGPQQDTANWCAFKHLCWPITGAVGGERADNCYGADPVFLGQSKDLDLIKMYDMDNEENPDPVITIADRIKARNKAKAKKEEEQKNKVDLKAQIEAGGVDEDEWEDFVDTPFRAQGRNKKINNDGKELYWNIQMFYGGDPEKYGRTDRERKTRKYDGDWCYVQRHLFEQSPILGTNDVVTDAAFNNFKLGKSVRDERECFLSNGGELPMGAYLHHLDGNPHKNIASELNMRKLEGEGKEKALYEWATLEANLKKKLGVQVVPQTEMYKKTPLRKWGEDFYVYTVDFQANSMVDEKFNNSHTQTKDQTYKGVLENAGIHISINDTEKLMEHYYEQDDGAPSINILCSCSPGYETAKTRRVDRNSVMRTNNETLRDWIEYLGRKGNYCKLRGAFIDARYGRDGYSRHPGIASLVQICNSPIYPQYEDHKGITLAGRDDREAFYINLGKTFQAIQAGVPETPDSAQPYTFSPLIFLAYYNTARNPAFAGSSSVSLNNFAKQYSRWYNGDEIKRGIHKTQNWISAPSIKRHLLLPYEREVELINNVESGLLTQGGARQLRFRWWGLDFIPATDPTEARLVPKQGERWDQVFGEGGGGGGGGAIPPPLPSTIFRGGSKTKKRRKRKRKRKKRRKKTKRKQTRKGKRKTKKTRKRKKTKRKGKRKTRKRRKIHQKNALDAEKIKKMVGGGKIKEINEKVDETEFEQKSAVINYGSGKISTYNLVNCLAIGGVFEINGEYGTFLTHESPTDHIEQINKLNKIKTKLDEKKANITQIVLFRIDKDVGDIYKDGLTTTSIIELMNTFSEDLFKLVPDIIDYSCDLTNIAPKCGKAIISPTEHKSVSIQFRSSPPSELDLEPWEFIVEVAKDSWGGKIYKCPECGTSTGTFLIFSHDVGCSNKNKIPKEEGGGAGDEMSDSDDFDSSSEEEEEEVEEETKCMCTVSG